VLFARADLDFEWVFGQEKLKKAHFLIFSSPFSFFCPLIVVRCVLIVVSCGPLSDQQLISNRLKQGVFQRMLRLLQLRVGSAILS
jgi:hypothetical protein